MRKVVKMTEISEEEYFKRLAESRKRLSKGNGSCRTLVNTLLGAFISDVDKHEMVWITEDERVRVRIKREFGETIQTRRIPSLWKCIRCNKVEETTPFGRDYS